MIKKLIKKIILKQCEAFGITLKEVMQIDIIAIIIVITLTLSVRPFFELVAKIIQL